MTRAALVRVAGACIVLDPHLAEQARDPERALDAVCRLVSHGDLVSDVWSGRDAPPHGEAGQRLSFAQFDCRRLPLFNPDFSCGDVVEVRTGRVEVAC